MNIRKRVEQEIKAAKQVGLDYENIKVSILEEVLTWIDAAKTTRKPRFVKPDKLDILAVFIDNGVPIHSAEHETTMFFNFYESKNWMVGKNKMVNWKSAVAGWVNRNKEKQQDDGRNSGRIRDTTEDGYKPVFDQMAGLKNRLDRDPELKALGKLANRSSNKPTRIGE